MQEIISLIRKRFSSDLKSIKPILKLVDKDYDFIKRNKDYILYYGEDPRLKTRKRPMGKIQKH